MTAQQRAALPADHEHAQTQHAGGSYIPAAGGGYTPAAGGGYTPAAGGGYTPAAPFKPFSALAPTTAGAATPLQKPNQSTPQLQMSEPGPQAAFPPVTAPASSVAGAYTPASTVAGDNTPSYSPPLNKPGNTQGSALSRQPELLTPREERSARATAALGGGALSYTPTYAPPSNAHGTPAAVVGAGSAHGALGRKEDQLRAQIHGHNQHLKRGSCAAAGLVLRAVLLRG